MKIIKLLFNSEGFLSKRTATLTLSISTLIYLLLIFPDTNLLFNELYHVGAQGTSHFLLPTLIGTKELLHNIGIPIHLSTPLLASLYLVSLILIIADIKPFIASVLALFIHLIFVTSGHLHSLGVDTYVSIGLFMNLMIQISRFDFKMNNEVYSYAVRFLQVQLCIIYFFAGFGKLLGTDWIDGNAMWLVSVVYVDGTSGEFFSNLLFSFPFLAMILSWGIVFLELCYPVIMTLKSTRSVALTAVILMHVGIGMFMGLYSFAIAMIAINLVGYGHVYKPLLEKVQNRLAPKGQSILASLFQQQTANQA